MQRKSSWETLVLVTLAVALLFAGAAAKPRKAIQIKSVKPPTIQLSPEVMQALAAARSKQSRTTANEDAHFLTGDFVGKMAVSVLDPMVGMEDAMQLMTTGTPSDVVPYAPLNQVGTQRRFADSSVSWLRSPARDVIYQSIWTWLGWGHAFAFHFEPCPEGLYCGWEIKQSNLYPFQQFSAKTINVSVAHDYVVLSRKMDNYLTAHQPAWETHLPAGYGKIVCSTEQAWLLGRTQVRSDCDLPAVHAYQNGTLFRPLQTVLSALNPIATQLGLMQPQIRVNYTFATDLRPAELRWYDKAGQYLRNNPLTETQDEFWKFFPRVGLTRTGFDVRLLNDRNGNRDAQKVQGMVKAYLEMKHIVVPVDQTEWGTWVYSWNIVDSMNVYNDYIHWDVYAEVALAALSPEEALYAIALTDSDGDYLVGTMSYMLHFITAPPVAATGFWSLSLYDMNQQLVNNTRQVFVINADTPGLVIDEDGSFDILVTRTDPEEGEFPLPNVLPSPADGAQFMLEIREYHPTAAIYSHTWKEPVITKVI